MSYESSNNFYTNHQSRSQPMMPTNQMSGSNYYGRPQTHHSMTNPYQGYPPSYQTVSPYDAYYASYNDPYEHQQRSMGVNYYGDNHVQSLPYSSSDNGSLSSMNDSNLMAASKDYPNSHMSMPMGAASQRNMTYNDPSALSTVHPSLRSHQQQAGDPHGNSSASKYSFGNPSMMNHRFPVSNRPIYQTDASKVQAYPQQTRYPAYSNTANGYSSTSQSTWPPVISAGTSESDTRYSHSQMPVSSLPSGENRSQDDDNQSFKTKSNVLDSPNLLDDVESSNSSLSDSQSVSNEKPAKKSKNSQSTPSEVLSKLREMGTEPERTLFVDRLQKLWEEHQVVCRKLPTLARQTIDLYRLYAAIREQSGLEQFCKVAKNRHWRDVAMKLDIPNCSTGALSIKQKYIALKLFHYECKYDRGGIDPEPILADLEKPKEKRSTKNVEEKPVKPSVEQRSATKPIDIDHQPLGVTSAPTTPSINYPPQQVPAPMESMYKKSEELSKVQLRPMPVSFPPDCVEATTISAGTKRRKLTAKDIPPVDPVKLLMSLRGGLLAETTWALDTINIMLADDQTHTYFSLKQMPGLLQTLLDIYIKCLTELFDEFHKEQEHQSSEKRVLSREANSVVYRIESHHLNRYQRKSIQQQDITYELVYDEQGNLKNNPEHVVDLQNLDDVSYVQTHLDPLHIDDHYYEHLYYCGHSDDTLSSDEHDQEPTAVLHGRSRTCETETSDQSNLKFLQCHKRKFPSDGPLTTNPDVDGHTNANNQQENALSIFTRYSLGYDQTCSRCICVSSILRNLSFIPGNDVELMKYQPLIHLLARLLLLRHDFSSISSSDKSTEESFNDQIIHDDPLKNEGRNSLPSFSWSECLIHVRENTLVTLTNIAGVLTLDTFNADFINQLIDGLLHWSTCYSDEAMDPLPSPNLSAQRLSIEILTKLSIHEMNMDFILATPPLHRIISLFRILTDWLNVDDMNTSISTFTRSQTYIQREFAIVLLNALMRCDAITANVTAHIPYTISLLITFLEDYEKKTNELNTRYGPDYLVRVSNSQQAEQLLFTTNDMLKRAASCLLSIVHQSDSSKSMAKYEDRILNLSISSVIDRNVGRILTDILHYCSLENS